MLGVNIGSAFAGDVDVKTMSSVVFDGNTLYVGGSGPNNYTSIQDAIDDAVDGDTVFVYDDSSPYREGPWIREKSINLIGEDKNTTILTSALHISSCDYVTISGFTLCNNYITPLASHGIDVLSADYLKILNTIIIGRGYGIHIAYSDYCTIEKNEIRDGTYGISLYHVFFSTFANNELKDNRYGIELNNARSNNISNNALINNGITLLDYAYPNYYSGNTVNSKPLLIFVDQHDLIIDNIPVGQLILIGCENIKIKNIEVSNATLGILIISSDNCLVTNSTIQYNCDAGITLIERCLNNVISYNDISFNSIGIMFETYRFTFEYNNIIGNRICFNTNGMIVDGAKSTIQDNIIENNDVGLKVSGSRHIIINNIISNSTKIGLYLYGSVTWCNIESNNFINNRVQAFFMRSLISGNHFRKNYWSNSFGFGPKAILGLFVFGYIYLSIPIIIFPIVQFDWNPAEEPYDIGG
jgi:parallel beta-helix repeat protein